jgi:hypothetical protein
VTTAARGKRASGMEKPQINAATYSRVPGPLEGGDYPRIPATARIQKARNAASVSAREDSRIV